MFNIVEEEKVPAQKSVTENRKSEEVITSTTTISATNIKEPSVDPQNKLDVGGKTGGLTCIGILPGLGTYSVSSDESDCSTDIEEDAGSARFDLLGRRIKIKTENSSNK